MKQYILILLPFFIIGSILISSEPAHDGRATYDERVKQYYNQSEAGKAPKLEKVADAKTPPAKPASSIPDKIDLTRVRKAQKKLDEPLRKYCPDAGCPAWGEPFNCSKLGNSYWEVVRLKPQQEKDVVFNNMLKELTSIARELPDNEQIWEFQNKFDCYTAAALCIGADPHVAMFDEKNVLFKIAASAHDQRLLSLLLSKARPGENVNDILAGAATIFMARELIHRGIRVTPEIIAKAPLWRRGVDPELYKLYYNEYRLDPNAKTSSRSSSHTALHDLGDACYIYDDSVESGKKFLGKRINNPEWAFVKHSDNHLKKARYLLEAGADATLRSENNKTAADIAEKEAQEKNSDSCRDLAAMLRKAEAEQRKAKGLC